MAELVDALDSGSSRGNSVDVRVILAAIFFVFHFAVPLYSNSKSCILIIPKQSEKLRFRMR